MATTTFFGFVKPRGALTTSAHRSSGFVAYIPVRAVSGLYSSSLNASTTQTKKDWRPRKSVAIGYVGGDRSKPVEVDDTWFQHFRYVGNNKLGGPNFPTLPVVASFVTQTQVDAQFSSAIDQFTTALAQSVAQMQEVVKAAGLAGAAQLPPVVLARQETNPTPISTPIFGDTGGGGGGD